MRKIAKICRARSSGQLFIVAAIAIALIISSITVYVYEFNRENQAPEDHLVSEYFLVVKQGSRNAVISALANISDGGEKTVLAENVGALSEAYLSVMQNGIYQLSYTLFNSSGYADGVKLLWSDNGLGVSSAYVEFTLETIGLTFNATMTYAVNVTTTAKIAGYYTINGTAKDVNITCQIFNEEEPALVKNITTYYEDSGVWLPVTPSIINYGNGTYILSFTVFTSSDPVQVSVHISDLRGILVQANATCSSL